MHARLTNPCSCKSPRGLICVASLGVLIFGRAYTWRGFSECHGISPKKLYSDFSYNLAFFHKNIKSNCPPMPRYVRFLRTGALNTKLVCPKRVAYLRSVVQSRSVHIRVNNCSHAIEKHKNRLQTLKKADIILETVAHFHGQILV